MDGLPIPGDTLGSRAPLYGPARGARAPSLDVIISPNAVAGRYPIDENADRETMEKVVAFMLSEVEAGPRAPPVQALELETGPSVLAPKPSSPKSKVRRLVVVFVCTPAFAPAR